MIAYRQGMHDGRVYFLLPEVELEEIREPELLSSNRIRELRDYSIEHQAIKW